MKKSEVRSRYRSLRASIDDSDVDQLSRQIFRKLQPIINKSSVIHTFLPIKKNREVNTWILIEEYLADHKVVISRTDFTNHQMRHFLYSKDTVIDENKMGIPEPVSALEFDPSQIEVVLVPLLAFDSTGNRVGYGKGYYDQFLADLNSDVLKIGLSLLPPVDSIKADAHDIRLDLAVTPEQTYNFKQS